VKIGRKILAAVLAVCIAVFCMPAAFAESAPKTTLRVGQLENSYQNEVFAAYAAQHGFSYTPVDYKETGDAFKALSAGELDAVAMGNLAVQTGYKTVGHFSSDPFYIITRKSNDEVLKNINYALSEINVVEPYYEAELYNKY
jgi:ABC-type amino acid transport substrate-binding protein